MEDGHGGEDGSGDLRTFPPGRAPLVLHVRAEPHGSNDIAGVLRSAGYRTVEALDAETALAIAREASPDVVILDALPRLTSSELIRRLRVGEATEHIAIVQACPPADGGEVGADAYLPRSHAPHELVALVRSLARMRVAEQLSREADELIAFLGHELRNPISAIRAALTLLERTHDRERIARLRTTVERQTEHLARLVESMLDVARVNHGKMQLDAKPIDLREIASGEVDAARASFEKMGVQLVTRLAADPVIVLGDATRLAQVVANLLDNALKYTGKEGTVEISVSVVNDGAGACLRVKDDGAGIDQSRVEGLFRLFSQGDTSQARRAGGLGIGLTVVQRLVSVHGGTTRVSSAGLGRGAEFTVELPIVTAPAAVSTREVQSGAAAAKEGGLHVRRILLVDDNDDARDLIAEILTSDGHVVTTANNGETAVSALLSTRFDVAVLDIGLPGVDGYEVARRAREALGDRVPVLVALTGYAAPRDREAAKLAGFDVHFVKPVDMRALLETVASSARSSAS